MYKQQYRVQFFVFKKVKQLMLEKITYCKVLIITIVKTFYKLQKMFNFWIFFLQKHFVELCGGQSNNGVHTGDVGPVGPRFSGDSERG